MRGYEHVDRNRQYTQVIVPIINHSTKDDDIMGSNNNAGIAGR